MQRVETANLQPGQVFDQGLFLPSGQKLLSSGVTLTPRHWALIRRRGDPELIFAESVEELEQAGLVQQYDRSKLQVGSRAATGLMTRTGQLLVEPGEEIEEHHLDAIEAGGGAFAGIGLDRQEWLDLTDDVVESLEKQLDSTPLRVTPTGEADWPRRSADPNDWLSLEQLNVERTAAVQTLRQQYARIQAGILVTAKAFAPVIDQLMGHLRRQPTQFTQRALLMESREDYLPDHAYNAAVLAMAIAANLKWAPDHVRQVGLAALLFDVGMLLVPRRIRVGAGALTDADRSCIYNHPLLSLSMLQTVSDVPATVRLAALQHHERENGSGYPRAKRRERICDFARVLAVADAFSATASPRRYRQRKLPYTAMEEMLRLASGAVFWAPAVRALVKSAGLFPVGSYVRLSSGERARVIGSHADAVDRPLVQILDDQDAPQGEPIDLVTIPRDRLNVVRPVE